jgi:hypothetical protein
MRFTEHEMTVGLTGAAKAVVAARRRDVRKGRASADEVWESMGRYERFQVLDALGSQVLPVLVALPDVEVAPGTRPSFTTEQVVAAVEEQVGDEGGKLKRKVTVASRVALVRSVLEHLPPRSDPDTLTVPDSL